MTPHELTQLEPGALIFVDHPMIGGVYLGEGPTEYELTSPSGSIACVDTVFRRRNGTVRSVHLTALTGVGAWVFNAFDDDDPPPLFPFRRLTPAEVKVARMVAMTALHIAQRYEADLCTRAPTGATYEDFREEVSSWARKWEPADEAS